MVLAVSDRVSRAPPYSGYCLIINIIRLQGCHLLWPAFPKPLGFYINNTLAALLPPNSRNCRDLGSSHFARRYSENHCCFLFLRVLRCFSSPGLPSRVNGSIAFVAMGCPIRVPADQFVFANPRSFSQLVTPFFASGSQGIPRTP
jgi:hypothetical protein